VVTGAAEPPMTLAAGIDAVPQASVIIATYNWSAALACAIKSVLCQTLRDFEILVIGDACTDDSEAVVAGFADPRIVWINLDANSGSQQGPNNVGLGIARGEWIAYLGHDDIWAPRHLESTIDAARSAGAEAAAGGMIMYGPPGSDAAATAGLFAEGRCGDDDFVPPSALVHRRALVDRIGRWRDPRALQLPTDCEFFQRVRAASVIVPSNQVTVFKCNAAARRNAYQSKSIDEQQALLAGLDRGDRFIGEELVRVVGSLHAGHSTRIRMPDPASVGAGEIFRANRIAKGVEPRFRAEQLRSLDADEAFRLDREATGYEWHAVEQHPHFGSFRWTGPAKRSTIELPVRLDRPLAMRIHVPWVIAGQSIDDIAVDAQGAAVDIVVGRGEDHRWILRGVIDPARHASYVPYVQITLSGITAARPADLGINADRRRLGIAVSHVELGPVTR
jgi:Glycosyl transferase family 2